MATGDVKWFAQGLLDLGNKIHSLNNVDTIKLGIVTNATAPSINTAVPCWGAAGTTDFSTSQVSTAGGYTGPITLSGVSWVLASNIPTFRAIDVTIPQNGSGFTDGAYAIIYNDTDANKRCLGFIEMSSAGTASIASGSIILNFQGAGTDVLKITPA